MSVTAPQLNSSNEFEVQRYTHNPTKLNMYYYNPDYLGISVYITNSIAKVIQHMEYLSFGETLVAEKQAKATEKKIAELNKGNAVDKNDIIAQLNKSNTDISDMRNDKNNEYKFDNSSKCWKT